MANRTALDALPAVEERQWLLVRLARRHHGYVKEHLDVYSERAALALSDIQAGLN